MFFIFTLLSDPLSQLAIPNLKYPFFYTAEIDFVKVQVLFKFVNFKINKKYWQMFDF